MGLYHVDSHVRTTFRRIKVLHPNFVILYVDNPIASAAFYTKLLNVKPLELEPTFALFSLESGLMFGLWSKHTVEPTTHMCGGGTELCFKVGNQAALNTIYADWKKQGLAILQLPTTMDFGITFVALDPDSHRLRVYVPANKEQN